MRLGAQPSQLTLGTMAAKLYGSFVINERHRHRYEFNNVYREKFEKAGFIFSGVSPDGKLVEIIELKDHPFFVASQFHPEFLSKPQPAASIVQGLLRRLMRAASQAALISWPSVRSRKLRSEPASSAFLSGHWRLRRYRTRLRAHDR